MFSRPQKVRDKGLIFLFSRPLKVDLHMFFVFYPIDVLFLDSNKKVVEKRSRFLPFTIHVARQPCNYVLELEQGAIERSKTELGDLIDW